MSRSVKGREKVWQKMTRDGLVERNAVTGEDVNISGRETDFDIRAGKPDREPLPQAGTGQGGKADARKKAAHRHGETLRDAETPAQQPDTPICEPQAYQPSDTPDMPEIPETANQAQHAAPAAPRGASFPARPGGRQKTQRNAAYKEHHASAARHEPGAGDSPLKHGRDAPASLDNTAQNPLAPEHGKGKRSAANRRQKQPAARHEPPADGALPEHKPAATKREPGNPGRTPQETAPAQDGAGVQPETRAADAPRPAEAATAPDSAARHKKTRKLQFAGDETAPAKQDEKLTRKLSKAEHQAGRAGEKLEKAKNSLPAKRKLRSGRVYDESNGKAKRRLYFEKEAVSQKQHLKGPLPLRPVKAATNTVMLNAHRKIYQVEHENVGIKAAHRIEMTAEAGVRSALRFHKTAPYRKVAKLERAAHKKAVNLTYRRALAENPKLKSNVLSRMWQKRKIKKDYAKAARETQKAAQRAKKAASATERAARAVGGFIRRHPIAATVIILSAGLIFIFVSLLGVGGGMGGGSISGIAVSTYLADDADMYAAADAYAGMEAALQHELDNYATLHPGYDEYAFDLDGIWHDPYALMSILGALHEGAWTLADVQGTLEMLFERQYILTETVTSETRYRTETTTQTDPVTGETYEEDTLVAYEYYICAVTLENFNLSHLPIYIMGEESLSLFAMYTATLGNRPDLFPASLYPHASYYKEYLRYDIPPEYLADETFAAMVSEANKYLGMPYVWGGYNPKTSFDCSGFVSWVLNNSGWDIGRLGAQGLYNISTPVSAADAKPGDLIFFHSTYEAEYAVTHVGIYVGDGMMVHAGDPIGYASINTAYWQNHLYAYGKLY